jgi:glycine/D-amino acid oxidase-like deaminating enzyme
MSHRIHADIAIIGAGSGGLSVAAGTAQFGAKVVLIAFKADPEGYAPRYGGYCAYAVSHNDTAEGDPKVWSIVGGKLYLMQAFASAPSGSGIRRAISPRQTGIGPAS